MKYDGMTVNERLYASGLMAKFEKAVKNKDVEKTKEILKIVELTDASIYPILIELGFSLVNDSTMKGDEEVD